MDADSGVELESLKVDGGMVANDLLMQFQADLLGVPVIRPKVAETTALGAAYAAGLADGPLGQPGGPARELAARTSAGTRPWTPPSATSTTGSGRRPSRGPSTGSRPSDRSPRGRRPPGRRPARGRLRPSVVGIVIVSHSAGLADGVVELARQMGGEELALEAAGGMEDGEIGTDAERVKAAIERARSDDGVLVLMDLGSAVMSAEMAAEMVAMEDADLRVVLSEAPLVEGAVAAAARARGGSPLDEVAAEARAALGMKASALGVEEEAGAGAPAPVVEETGPPGPQRRLHVGNRLGLHARPAARFVEAAGRFEAVVTVSDETTGRGPVDGRSLTALVTLGVRQGHDIVVRASGRRPRRRWRPSRRWRRRGSATRTAAERPRPRRRPRSPPRPPSPSPKLPRRARSSPGSRPRAASRSVPPGRSTRPCSRRATTSRRAIRTRSGRGCRRPARRRGRTSSGRARRWPGAPASPRPRSSTPTCCCSTTPRCSTPPAARSRRARPAPRRPGPRPPPRRQAPTATSTTPTCASAPRTSRTSPPACCGA